MVSYEIGNDDSSAARNANSAVDERLSTLHSNTLDEFASMGDLMAKRIITVILDVIDLEAAGSKILSAFHTLQICQAISRNSHSNWSRFPASSRTNRNVRHKLVVVVYEWFLFQDRFSNGNNMGYTQRPEQLTIGRVSHVPKIDVVQDPRWYAAIKTEVFYPRFVDS